MIKNVDFIGALRQKYIFYRFLYKNYYFANRFLDFFDLSPKIFGALGTPCPKEVVRPPRALIEICWRGFIKNTLSYGLKITPKLFLSQKMKNINSVEICQKVENIT
uniref:Uncharacterized protein n=1 Tax=Romanomermis culicivorax TaxID=13658 RepID=A0A915J3W4_ROMCU